MLAATPSWASTKPLSAKIVMHDHGFGFRNISFRTPSVRLTVTNRGTTPHALAVRPGGAAKAGTITRTNKLSPGQSAKLTLTLKPGRYRIFSPVDHDSQRGLAAPMTIMVPSPTGGTEMNWIFYDSEGTLRCFKGVYRRRDAIAEAGRHCRRAISTIDDRPTEARPARPVGTLAQA